MQTAVTLAVISIWVIGLNWSMQYRCRVVPQTIGFRVRLRAPAECACGMANGPVIVAVGVMVSHNAAVEVVEAIHYSVQHFNHVQDKVRIELRFFTGRQSHPMVAKLMADEVVVGSSHNTTSPRGVPLPQFVRGDFRENMNHGKTREWFRYAAKAFPSSDWIMKLDADVSVNWTALQPQLLDTNAKLRYIGVVNDFFRCSQKLYCPPKECWDMAGKCWVYMSGGFYGLSRDLARHLASCKYFEENAIGHEDLKLGQAVKACTPSPEAVKVINVMPIGHAWCHSKHLKKGQNATLIRLGWSPGDCL